MNTWDEVVSTLNHPSGFMKFSDMIIESTHETEKDIVANDSDLVAFLNLDREMKIDTYPSFDLITENSLNINDDKIASNQIFFNSRILTDYYESVGNRVLVIDDISSQFNSEPRATRFGVTDSFDIEQTYKKFFTLVKDKTFTGERQCMFVSLLHNGAS